MPTNQAAQPPLNPPQQQPTPPNINNPAVTKPPVKKMIKADITLPEGAQPGDKLSFAMNVGPNGAPSNFSAVVPASSGGGKLISVSVPVPDNWSGATPIVSDLRLNGQPIARRSAAPAAAPAAPPAPELTGEQKFLMTAQSECRARIDAHLNRFAPTERAEATIALDTSAYRPATRRKGSRRLGAWSVARTTYHVPAASSWPVGSTRELQRQRLHLSASSWSVALEGTCVAHADDSEGSERDIELSAVLRRSPPEHAAHSMSGPLSVVAAVEWANRWSPWTKVSLLPGARRGCACLGVGAGAA